MLDLLMAGAVLMASLPGSAPAHGVVAPAPGVQDSPRATDDTVHLDPAWTTLGDDAVAALQRAALEAAPALRRARLRAVAASESRALASADRLPTLTADAGWRMQRLAAAGFPFPSDGSLPRQELWDGGLDARWEADLFGRLGQRVASRAGEALAATATAADVERRLLGDVARTYAAYRAAAAREQVARNNAAAQLRILELTRTRLAAGTGTDLDVARAEAQYATTETSLPRFTAQRTAAAARLAELTGLEAPAVETLIAAQPLVPLPAAGDGTALQLRPDVVAASARASASAAALKAAKADRLPRLSVGASAGITTPALRTTGDAGTVRYAVGPVLTWSFLGLGRANAAVRIEQANLAAAEADLEAVTRRAAARWIEAEATYAGARRAAERAEAAAASAARAARLARLRFEEGVADFLQVLDAERSLLAAQDAAVAARALALDAWATLTEEQSVMPAPAR